MSQRPVRTAFDLNSYISELRATVIQASLNYGIWRTYNGEDTRPKYVQVINDYVMFFRTSIHAHFVALLIALYRIYETRRDTYNLPQMLRILRKSDDLPAGGLDELEALYAQALPLWHKVSVLRNEAFGHRALNTDTSKVFQKAAVTPDQLQELISLTQTFLNRLSSMHSQSVHAFSLDSRGDTIRLLDDLTAFKAFKEND